MLVFDNFFIFSRPSIFYHFNKSQETIKQQSFIDGEFPTSNCQGTTSGVFFTKEVSVVYYYASLGEIQQTTVIKRLCEQNSNSEIIVIHCLRLYDHVFMVIYV
jgi:hypothetical protein